MLEVIYGHAKWSKFAHPKFDYEFPPQSPILLSLKGPSNTSLIYTHN